MPRSNFVTLSIARPKAAKHIATKENAVSHTPPLQPSPAQLSRRERPCDACRRRKSRCVIHEGAVLCVLCEFHKQECTFVQRPLPRKRKVASHGLEVESAQKRSSERGLPVVPAQQPSLTTTFSRRPPQAPDATGNPLQETLGQQRQQHCRYIGHTTPLDPLLINLTPFDARNQKTCGISVLRKVNDTVHFIILPDENPEDLNAELKALNRIEAVVAPHGSLLIDEYFRSVHPNLPIVHKALFMQRHRHADGQISPTLLAGMYILALERWSSEPALPKPDVGKLQRIALHRLLREMERPKLSTIQAGLLLLQRLDDDFPSLSTTQLVAIGQELGLHHDCSEWSIPFWEMGLRKRIAWALYMQDKWSSLSHGRPSHIRSADWAVKPISDDDFRDDGMHAGEVLQAHSSEEAVDQKRAAYVFVQMIALTAILAEVMDTLHTQTAIQDFQNADRDSTRLILDRARPVQIKLKQWFNSLPASARIKSHVSGDSSNSAMGALHLAYFAAEITLHRRIIQSLDPNTTDPYLLYICRSAAKMRLIGAMDLTNRLTPAHLRAFWYTASRANFALISTFGSVLWASALSSEEAEFYRARLLEHRWTLTVSATHAPWLGYAVRMLDASYETLLGMDEKRRLAGCASAQEHPIPVNRDGRVVQGHDTDEPMCEATDGPATR